MNTSRPDRARFGRIGPSVGLVGCGAIGERQHLPRLVERTDCHVTHLVDADLERAEELAARHDVPRATADFRDLLDEGVEAAIVAVPNVLHAPIAVELLRGGVHVLVEKPMATDVAGCDDMLAASREGGAVIAVGHIRRFAGAVRFGRRVLEDGFLGRLRSFHVRDGFVFDWPIRSPTAFRREWAGGGVLADLGCHVLDILLWWFGDLEVLEYRDDAAGGVEADAWVRLRTEDGVEGVVDVSRTRTLPGSARLVGERGELEIDLWGSGGALRLGGRTLRGDVLPGTASGRPSQRIRDLFRAEHDDFFAAIRERRNPAVTGEAGRRVVELVARCYEMRRPWIFPWTPFAEPPAQRAGRPRPGHVTTWTSPAEPSS